VEDTTKISSQNLYSNTKIYNKIVFVVYFT
jgi:hypothetical protein